MEGSIKHNLTSIIKGVAISITFTMIFLLIFSAVLTYTNVSEEWTQPVIIVLTSISILIGSSIGSLKLKKNGILNGATIGLIYFIIIYLISSIISSNFSVNSQMIITVIAGTIFGIIGGIIGINKK